ncbi:protein WVD2-like 7 isoform X2 [Hevea brasiliensis]|uniref:protein WVD2-like 7 isoform X2 n=1 Tax=Hevea brasiliensis TaxID=3981 RepID=UPI000B7986F3|nr:protein WVD2-like 7 isoform X2 [Hevea brasiliensis]
MAASSDKDKMGETAASDRALEVSVSFGRFENDSLSWEKWSSFSKNKYMEEVEKCATPGSVAEKKAYFEAHYKKIAARKAEQMGEHDSLGSYDQNGGDLIEKARGTDSEFDIPNCLTSAEGTEQETKLNSELGSGQVDEDDEDAAINVEGQGSSIERLEEVLGSRLDGFTLNKPEEAALAKEEKTLCTESQVTKDSPKNLDKEKERIAVIKEENLKLDHHKESQKTSPMSKIRDMTRVKKKPASPVAKSPQVSTPKVPKTMPTSSTLSMLQPSTKKVTDSALAKGNNPSMEESKKAAPKSLHMSLSLDAPNSGPAAHAPAPMTTTRKSFIMEKMKDKDIVKRAFKTFQNNLNQLKASAEERSLGAKQVPTKGTEAKVSYSMTPQKENAGVALNVFDRSFKAASMDKKIGKAGPSSFGLKSDERAEKRKEFSKKWDEKSKAKEAKSKRLQTKSKEKEVEIRKLRQSLNFKATPMPGFYRGQKVSKSPLDKEGSKTLEI